MQGGVRVIYKKSIFQKTHLPVLSINFFKLSQFDTCGTPIFLGTWTKKKKQRDIYLDANIKIYEHFCGSTFEIFFFGVWEMITTPNRVIISRKPTYFKSSFSQKKKKKSS